MVGLAIAGGLVNIASSLFGGISQNKRRKEAEELMEQRRRQLDAWKDAEMNTNYLDRADSRDAVRRVMEYNKEAQKAADTRAIKGGLSDEAKVAQAARNNKSMADIVGRIASAGAQHKDNVRQRYLGETRNLDNLKISNLMDSSGVENMIAGVGNALTTLNSALSTPKIKKTNR